MNTSSDSTCARYGLIVPSSNRMAEPHASRFTPAAAVPHVTRLRMTGAHFMPLDELLPKVAEAAVLLADARCDPVVFHCTANSMAEETTSMSWNSWNKPESTWWASEISV